MSANENQLFSEFAREIFLTDLELDPQRATYLGLHEYDGRVPEVSEASLNNQATVYRDFLKRLKSIDRSELTVENKYDYDIAVWGLSSSLFNLEELKSHKLNPMTYAFMFGDLHNYISRDYAPFEERIESIIKIISKIPESLAGAEKLLESKLPKVLCDFAISFSKGYEDFFNGELLKLIEEKVTSKDLIEKYKEKSGEAVEAFGKYIKFLENASDEECKSYILGREKFSKMLSLTEHIEIPLEELKQMGMDELKRLHDNIEAIVNEHKLEGGINKLEHEHPSNETLVDETAGTLQELVDFIRSKDLVSLPDKLNCIVTEMPRYMNFGFAAMGTAGPFEKSDESFYYVNLPEKDWDEEKKEEWMTQFNYPTLTLISIHEAFPGHYTHFLNANIHSTDLSKLFMSYSYVEGWAHYTEEMMIEQGFGNDDYKTEIGMYLEALIRCCRFIVAIGIHCEGMTIDEAKDFFLKNAYMAEVTAEQEAKRGAFDPGYLNYTLGKIMLKEFKLKYFSKFGTSKTLKDFHNSIVSLGAPTFRIAEELILN
jgi:uncharacterized protein (DUF885 family)